MLPTSINVTSVYSGTDGLLSSLQSDSLCIDSSTIDQSVASDVGAAVQDKGAMFVDAPVSGGWFPFSIPTLNLDSLNLGTVI